MRCNVEHSDSKAPRYRCEVDVQLEDMDEFGHVSNISFVRWVRFAALAHSTAIGWDPAAYLALGAVFVVRRHEIDYHAPAFSGDRLQLCTWVEWARAASALRRTEITRLDGGALLASASTLWVLATIPAGRPCRIPDGMRRSFMGH